MPKSPEEHLIDVDRVLEEVREMLNFTEGSESDELIALQMLLKITKELHNIHNTRDLITKVLDSAIAFADGDRAFLMLLEDGEARFKMGRDRKGQYLTREDFSPSTGVINETLATLKTIVVPDAQNDEHFSVRESVQDLSLRTIMCSPMTLKGIPLGLLYVDSSSKPLDHYSKAQINVLASLADQSAVAIANAQKFETQY